MTAVDAQFRQLAKDQIDEFGTAATIVRTTSTFNNVTNVATTTAANYSIKISPPSVPVIQEVDGDHVRRDDLFALVADLNNSAWTPPRINDDTVTFQGTNYKIVGVTPTYSGDQIAMYKIQMRK